MTWAWEIKGLDIYEKMVLLRLADHANAEGFCYPGKVGLAESCCISKRKVDLVILDLQAKGLVRIEDRSKGGRSATNVYHLMLDQLPLFDSQIAPNPAHHAGFNDADKGPEIPLNGAQCAGMHGVQGCTAEQETVHTTTINGAQCAPESTNNLKRTVKRTPPGGTAVAVDSEKPKKPDELKTELWNRGVNLLTGQGIPDRKARTLLGKVAKELGEPAALEVVALAEGKADAASFLSACAFKIKLPTDNRKLWQIRAAIGLETYYDDSLEDCHAEIRQQLRRHPERRSSVEALQA
jgi:hypothetical protein